MLDVFPVGTLQDVHMLLQEGNLKMIDKLNELLRGRFIVLHIDKMALNSDEPDYAKEYYVMYLRSESAGNDFCKIRVTDFRVISVDGQMFVYNIEFINKALAEIKEMVVAA